jgi:acrylyl-CoA reductase (NADPH)
MTGVFRAFRIHEQAGVVRASIDEVRLEDLSPGDVLVRIRYSSVNYKDALAATGRGRIVRHFPLVGGVDAAGVVESCAEGGLQSGDPVLVHGCGLGETHDGGFAEYLRVPTQWVVKLPSGLGLLDAMAIGTAGFSAALALQRMEDNGQQPEQGPVVVTGAGGGVGSLTVDIFSQRGYEVVAITGRSDLQAYLTELGARRVLRRADLQFGTRALETGLWAGAVDNVGGEMLAWLTRTVRPWGNIASIGLVGGSDLSLTVMPFILRGVTLLGVSSSNCPMPLRRRIWGRLAGDLHPAHLQRIVSGVLPLEALPEAFDRILSGQVTGRLVVALDQEGQDASA